MRLVGVEGLEEVVVRGLKLVLGRRRHLGEGHLCPVAAFHRGDSHAPDDRLDHRHLDDPVVLAHLDRPQRLGHQQILDEEGLGWRCASLLSLRGRPRGLPETPLQKRCSTGELR